jgi:hypothetical protein
MSYGERIGILYADTGLPHRDKMLQGLFDINEDVGAPILIMNITDVQ